MSIIKHLDYKGEKLPIRINYLALKKFKAEADVDFEDLDLNEDLEHYETLLYWALKSGHNGEDKEFNFKKEQMEEVLDEVGVFEFVDLLSEFFPANNLTEEEKKVLAGNRQQRREQKRKTKQKKKQTS